CGCSRPSGRATNSRSITAWRCDPAPGPPSRSRGGLEARNVPVQRPAPSYSGKTFQRRPRRASARHAIGPSGDRMTSPPDPAVPAILAARASGVAGTEMRAAASHCPITMVQALRARAASQANELAFAFLDHNGKVVDRITFAALDARARSIGSKLASRGLRGERVALVFPPGLGFVAALFGCFYAGCVAVPAPYLVGKRAIDRFAAIFKDCTPAAVLAPSQLESAAEIRRTMPSNFVDWIHVDAVDPSPQDWDPPPIGPIDLALLQYTSGSTSEPRGVM